MGEQYNVRGHGPAPSVEQGGRGSTRQNVWGKAGSCATSLPNGWRWPSSEWPRTVPRSTIRGGLALGGLAGGVGRWGSWPKVVASRYDFVSMSEHGHVALSWPGRATQIEVPSVRLSPCVPGGSEPWLVEGDNAAVLGALRKPLGGKVTLVYLDPPFLTQRQHCQVVRSRSKTGDLVRMSHPAFDDRWENLGAYLSELRVRLELSRELLTPDGCLVLHVDPKTSHYAKILLDEIFGPECFASEIVWRYRRWPSKTPNFQRVHDVLLRYVRDSTKKPKFRQLYEPLAASTQAVWGTRRQRAVVGPSGRRVRSSTESEESPGVPLGDVWDIGIVAPVAKERTGYPTQKPELLLTRLVLACTDPGDIVLDPYMGSGTTLAACLRHQRRMVGIDLNPEAVRLTTTRLRTLGAEPLVSHVVEQGRPSLCRVSVDRPESPSSGKKRVA